MSFRFTHWIIAGLLLAIVGAGGTAFAQFSEADVKAAFIYNITKYIEWSSDTLPADAPLRLCVVGPQTPLCDALSSLAGKHVRGRNFEVRTGVRADATRACQVIVLQPGAARLPASTNGQLTISEQEGFVDAGGMIGLSLSENRVQFEANLDAIRRNEMQISAQLLKLARRVKGN